MSCTEHSINLFQHLNYKCFLSYNYQWPLYHYKWLPTISDNSTHYQWLPKPISATIITTISNYSLAVRTWDCPVTGRPVFQSDNRQHLRVSTFPPQYQTGPVQEDVEWHILLQTKQWRKWGLEHGASSSSGSNYSASRASTGGWSDSSFQECCGILLSFWKVRRKLWVIWKQYRNRSTCHFRLF